MPNRIAIVADELRVIADELRLIGYSYVYRDRMPLCWAVGGTTYTWPQLLHLRDAADELFHLALKAGKWEVGCIEAQRLWPKVTDARLPGYIREKLSQAQKHRMRAIASRRLRDAVCSFIVAAQHQAQAA